MKWQKTAVSFHYVGQRTERAVKMADKGFGRTRLARRAAFIAASTTRSIKMIKKLSASLFAMLFMAGLFGTLAGCNTIEGAGKDIQRGGEAIKDEAREHKNY
jgi:predicted small secreted protein